MKARFTYDSYSTHQPILYEAVMRTAGPVIEFGCGHGSTPMLHRLCQEQHRPLTTLESNREWLDKFRQYETADHKFIYVDSWLAILTDVEIVAVHYDLAFVDQSPWAARYATIQALRDKAKYIVLHDCDYFPEHGMLGENIDGLNGVEHIGKREYVFNHWKEFFPGPPWPYPRTGPPTLLASETEDCDWEIDFEKYKEQEIMA